MSHGAFIRASGVYAANSVFTHTEMAAFDLAQYKAVNGDEGGIWAPSTSIRIGGSGLAVSGSFAASGAFTASGATSEFADTEVSITGTATLLVEGPCVQEIQSGALIDIKSGGAAHVEGALSIQSGGNSYVQSGADFWLQTGSTTHVRGTATMGFIDTASATFATGTTLSCAAGSAAIFEADGVILTGSGDPHYGTARAFTDRCVAHSVVGYAQGYETTPTLLEADRFGYVITPGSGGFNGEAFLSLQLPLSATIKKISVAVKSSGLNSVSGSTQPFLKLWATAPGSTSASIVGTIKLDPNYSSGYTSDHTITLDEADGSLPSGGFAVVDGTSYVLEICGDYANRLSVGAPRMSGTLAKLRLV